MKKLILVISASLISLTLLGQHSLSLKLDIGASKILTPDFGNTIEHVVCIRPSGNLGLSYKYHIFNHISVRSDLTFSQIEGQTYDITGVGDYGGNIRNDLFLHITYLSIPVFLCYNQNKFSFDVGIHGSLVIYEQGQLIGVGTLSSEDVFYDYLYTDINIDNYDFGLISSIKYKLTKKIDLELQYYHGLNSINATSEWWYNRQVGIGIHYKLIEINS